MGNYQRYDRYYHKAKAQGLPSRASFKIDEILNKFKIAKSGDWVLDLGAAPGGWTVMLGRAVGGQGKVLAIDLGPLSGNIPTNVEFLQADLESPEAFAWVEQKLGNHKLQAVCSDLSPKLSGIAFRDAYLSFQLAEQAWKYAERFLAPGGSLVTKIFPGEEFPGFLEKLKRQFAKVTTFTPQATRGTSIECYVLALKKQIPLKV